MIEKPSTNERTSHNTDEQKEPISRFLQTIISKSLSEFGIVGKIIAAIGRYMTIKK